MAKALYDRGSVQKKSVKMSNEILFHLLSSIANNVLFNQVVVYACIRYNTSFCSFKFLWNCLGYQYIRLVSKTQALLTALRYSLHAWKLDL